MQKLLNSNIATYSLILCFFLIYLLIPTQNSTIDAYNYAANVKWNHDIFFPHHLLFNLPAYLIVKSLRLFDYQGEVLALMKFINAFFAVLGLLVLSKILSILDHDKRKNLPIVLIAASCFGFMRYATENETYIIPIFWSLLSSFYYLKFLKSNAKKDILLTGFFAVISCLFHQIHILWYVGLLIGTIFYKKDFKSSVLLALPAVLLPIVYYLAFKQVHFEFKKAENLWQFVFFDYYFGTARIQFGIDNFILGFISFIRSFIQVHGIIPILIKKNYFYALAIVPLLFSTFQFIKYLWITKFEKTKPTVFVKILIIIFSLQFAFSVFSEGNVEFMVMLPLLLLLIFNSLIKIKPIIYLYIGIAIFVWNLLFGLVPNYLYDFQSQGKTIQIIDNKRDAIFIVSEDVLVQNIIYYRTGIRWNTSIYKSPESLKQFNKFDFQLKSKIDSVLLNNLEVITDCIDEPKVMSRKLYFSLSENELFFKNYIAIKIDSVPTLIGTKYICLIKKIK